MSGIVLVEIAAASVPTPAAGKVTLFADASNGGVPSFKDDAGVVTAITSGDAELAAVAGLTSAADRGIIFTGSGTAALFTLTAAGLALLDDAASSNQRTTLGLGTIATQDANNVSITGGAIAGITDLAVADGGTGASTAAGARTNLGVGAVGQLASIITTIPYVIEGGGSAITTGLQGGVHVPFACTIVEVVLAAVDGLTGSIVVDIWKDSYANFPPTVADTITAAAKPTISAATKSKDATLTGWTTSVAADDFLFFNVDSAATLTRVLVSLKVTKTT